MSSRRSTSLFHTSRASSDAASGLGRWSGSPYSRSFMLERLRETSSLALAGGSDPLLLCSSCSMASRVVLTSSGGGFTLRESSPNMVSRPRVLLATGAPSASGSFSSLSATPRA